jgi:hypothetical protein
MKKAGRAQGFQIFHCRRCKAYYRDGARLHKLRKRERRRYLAWIRWEQVLEAINQAAQALPPDMREEVIQEMALASLDGSLDLVDIPRAVPFYRSRVSRQADRYRFVSLDQPLGYEGGLTYAELLAG